MIANLDDCGIALTGANQSTPMISYSGKKTIQDNHMLSRRNNNQLPAKGSTSVNKKYYLDREEKKLVTIKPSAEKTEDETVFNTLTPS